MGFGRKKYTAVIIGISIILLLSTANMLSFFKLLNGYCYDLLLHGDLTAQTSDELILIEMEKEFQLQGDEVWLKVFEELLQHDCKQIAFTFMPENTSEKFYQLAQDSGRVVFGLPRVKGTDGLVNNLQQLPLSALKYKLEFGLLDTAPLEYGVARRQYAFLEANGIRFPGFENKVSGLVLNDKNIFPDDSFYINFIGGEERIPRVNVKRILNGGLVSELVTGRVVLIGVKGLEKMPSYFTPVASDNHLTSDVLYHAFALDTLLSDRVITTLANWIVIICIVLITVVNLFLFQWLSFQMSMVMSFVVSLIYLLCCWVALQFLFLWIPFAELFFTQWLSFILVWRYRFIQEDRHLNQMLMGVSLKLREKINPVSIFRSEEPWEQLVAMINQTLNVNRLIFLERVPGDHRLKEIVALNCSIDDIKELRRDYERTPYSTAISEHKPILLDRPYLTEVNQEEKQYLAPLIFAGEIMGFWAFTIEPSNIQSKFKFNALTYNFMVQISEILHYRQEWQKREQQEDNKLLSYLRIEGGDEHLHKLNQSVTLIDKRISELQEVFNSIKTSCVLYDLFGRVLLVNKYMEEFAKAVDLRLFNLTMLEFIVEISEQDESKSRLMLQQVVFDHETVAIPVTHNRIKRNYMLYIKPLKHEEDKVEDDLVPHESNIFQISGVLIELIDMTDLKGLYQLKEKMFERFSFQIRNDLSAILFALPMLGDETITQDEKQFAVDIVQGKVDETLSMLEMVKEQMDVDIENMVSHTLLCYPVDGRIPVQRVIAQLKEKTEAREINIHLKLPELISLVFASPLELEIVLNAVLIAMIDDTYQGGDVWLEIEESGQNVFYRMHNSGIGISDAKLQQLQDKDIVHEAEMINFHNAIRCVNRWGGSLNISSQVGEGSKAELLLRRFM